MVRECEGGKSGSRSGRRRKSKKKSGTVGRPTDQKKQKKGLVNDLDSLKNELWNAILAKKRKKTPKN
jgi:hypothetical protein